MAIFGRFSFQCWFFLLSSWIFVSYFLFYFLITVQILLHEVSHPDLIEHSPRWNVQNESVDQSVKTIIRGGRSVGFTNWILMILNETYRLDSFERNWEEYVVYQRKMDGRRSYVPPAYVPLGQSDSEAEIISGDESHPTPNELKDGLSQWSSGICACCDDMQSCTLLSAFWPWFMRRKNYEGASCVWKGNVSLLCMCSCIVSKFKYLNCTPVVVSIREPIIYCLNISMPCHLFVECS